MNDFTKEIEDLLHNRETIEKLLLSKYNEQIDLITKNFSDSGNIWIIESDFDAMFIAKEIANIILPDNKSSHKDTAVFHSDLFILDKESEISIDDIRAIKGFLQKSAISGSKVVIVNHIDYLNDFSSNALLKLTEDIIGKSMILLLSKNMSRVKKTILSRSMKTHMPQIKFDILFKDLKKEFAVVYLASGGCLKEFMNLLRNLDHINTIIKFDSFLKGHVKFNDIYEALDSSSINLKFLFNIIISNLDLIENIEDKENILKIISQGANYKVDMKMTLFSGMAYFLKK